MKKHSSIMNIFNRDRKILYIILSIVMISVLTITVVYAALSTALNINGNAEVTAANWDIYLDNVQLNSGSATTVVPTISNKTTATFSTTLTNPGDYYMFTIDVVNNGSIDAMIDSVTKIPELTAAQAKYLNYIVEYQNGEAISTKQLVSKNSFVRLKVKLEFRKDITASDLPTASETLNLSFKVNYVQSDNNSENIPINNNGKLIKIISGDLNTIGSEICIGKECFYLMKRNENNVTMLAKYNLYVGRKFDNKWTSYGNEATGLQDSTMLGYLEEEPVRNGTIEFSFDSYWSNAVNLYPIYVYDSNSNLYKPLENYKEYLMGLGITVEEARIISLNELELLGCSINNTTCTSSQYKWLYDTTYWTGTASSSDKIWYLYSTGKLSDYYLYNSYDASGIRPVITVSKSEF